MEIASATYHISTLLHLSPTVEWWFIHQDLSSTPATRSSGTMACFPRRQTACSSCTTWRYYELTNSVRPADKRWSWRNAQRHSTEKDAAGNAPVDALHHQELEAFSRAATWPTANSSRSFAEGKSVRAAAGQGNLGENTVRRFFNKIHEQIAEEILTSTKIGGVGGVGTTIWYQFIATQYLLHYSVYNCTT